MTCAAMTYGAVSPPAPVSWSRAAAAAGSKPEGWPREPRLSPPVLKRRGMTLGLARTGLGRRRGLLDGDWARVLPQQIHESDELRL
jgi:hypothetical protein